MSNKVLGGRLGGREWAWLNIVAQRSTADRCLNLFCMWLPNLHWENHMPCGRSENVEKLYQIFIYLSPDVMYVSHTWPPAHVPLVRISHSAPPT